MTPCEKLGYQVGDEFEATGKGFYFSEGSIVKFTGEFGCFGNPLMALVSGKCGIRNAPNGELGAYEPIENFNPVPRNAITLRPGDYVSTDGITEDEYHAVAAAFMAARAEKGEYPNWGFVTKTSADSFGWLPGGDLYHHLSHEFKRHLTINQVLNATNEPGKKPQQETTPMTTIDTLHEAKRQRDEAAEKLETAEAVLNVALDAVQTELGVGFIVKEAGDSDLVERTLGRVRCGEDLSDPANWRKGDVVRAAGHSIDITKSREYIIDGIDPDGDIYIKDDAGDVEACYSENFTFVRRP